MRPVVAAPVRPGAGVGLKPVAADHMRTPADAVAELSAGAAERVNAGQPRDEGPAAAMAPAQMSAGAAQRVDAPQAREEAPPGPARVPNAELRTADRSGYCPGRRAESAASDPEGIRRARS
ncbi:hypothetical protein A4G31_12565 [Mycobacterium persicum]|nr:hypothetical protein A4G31_12565 [Mycobacterium persicum]